MLQERLPAPGSIPSRSRIGDRQGAEREDMKRRIGDHDQALEACGLAPDGPQQDPAQGLRGLSRGRGPGLHRAQLRMDPARQALDLPLCREDERLEPAATHRPEVAPLFSDRVLEEERARIEQPGDALEAERPRLAERGVPGIVPADLRFDAVELGEELLDLPGQGGVGLLVPPGLPPPQLPVGLDAQQIAQGLPPFEQRCGDGAPTGDGVSGMQDVEQAAGAGLLADLQGRAIVAPCGIGLVLVHEEIDAQCVGAALRREKRGAQAGADEAGPQLFHFGHGGLGMGVRLVAKPQRPLHRRQGMERLGLAGAVAQGLAPRQGLAKNGERLPRPARPSQRMPPQVKGLDLFLPIACLPQMGEGRIDLAERGGGIALLELDLGDAQPGERGLPGIAQDGGQLQGLPVMVERLLQIPETAPGEAEVVQGDQLLATVAGLPAEHQGPLEKGQRTLRLPQGLVGIAEIVEQRGLFPHVSERRQDPPCLVIEAQRLLPLAQGTVDHGDVDQGVGLAGEISERPAQSEGLVVVVQCGVGLAQAVVDAAEVVENPRLVAPGAHLAEERESRLVTGQRHRQGPASVIEEAELAVAPLSGEALSQALPQGESLLQRRSRPFALP